MTKPKESLKPNFDTILYSVNVSVATITMNRPEKRNAISTQMIEDILEALNLANNDPFVRVLILTGAGKAFCAGVDLDALNTIAKQSPEENLGDSRLIARLFHRLYSFPKPVIAAVNGAAIAGGCGFATFTDITLAVPEAKFGYTEVRIGFIPALVSVMLRRQIGEKRSRELLLTGRTFDATEGYRLGLVTEIVQPEDLMERANEYAKTFLAASPTSLEHTKRLLLHYDDEEIREEIELAIQANAKIRATADFREGVAAFLEKRTPNWTGR
ncbi:MAG: enoyl-CoA hydratase-related protein [Candidatus Acidiferrales bacterium]